MYGYTLDKQDKLPPDVVELVGKTVPSWKFTPIPADGKPVPSKSLMSLRVVAHKVGADNYAETVRRIIRSA